MMDPEETKIGAGEEAPLSDGAETEEKNPPAPPAGPEEERIPAGEAFPPPEEEPRDEEDRAAASPENEGPEKEAEASPEDEKEKEPEEEPEEETLPPDVSLIRPKRRPFGLFRGELPKLDRKSVALMLVITLVYSILAFFRLGTTEIPQTSIYLAQKGQSVTVELKEPAEVSKFCLYKWRGRKKDITIETRLSPYEEWHVAYGPEELSSHMRWKTLDLDVEGEVKYVRITFEGKEITLAELCVLDKNNERLEITAPKELNAKLLDADNLANLTDEQELLDADSSSLTFAYFDEYLYALTANAYIHGGTGLENTHPVLGKVVESLGIRIFGMNSIGWRIMGTLSGILMLPVFFFLARRVLRSNKWALCATFLMAVEAMHYTQTRLATIDSFPLLFILLAYLFMTRFYQHPTVEGEKINLFLSGLSFGMACSFKWIGAYAGVGLAITFFTFFVSKIRAYKRENADFYAGRYVASTLASCVIFFILVPVTVYVGSYLPVAFGPFEETQGWAGIWENQKYMWNFHSTL
ncbi:MAG: phospholipid carrier-dependent glycosyltransferase, partial [Clostridia bacterium]|nr:phospholipid carrier-dependent glycosyltransferase [Clostridia bacterium]